MGVCTNTEADDFRGERRPASEPIAGEIGFDLPASIDPGGRTAHHKHRCFAEAHQLECHHRAIARLCQVQAPHFITGRLKSAAQENNRVGNRERLRTRTDVGTLKLGEHYFWERGASDTRDQRNEHSRKEREAALLFPPKRDAENNQPDPKQPDRRDQ